MLLSVCFLCMVYLLFGYAVLYVVVMIFICLKMNKTALEKEKKKNHFSSDIIETIKDLKNHRKSLLLFYFSFFL